MSKYLVTGGAGFIGSHIVEELLKKGDEVVILDNFYTGKKGNLLFLESLKKEDKLRCKIIDGDIRDLDLVMNTVRGCDYIIHHAAIVIVSESVFEPGLTNDVNVNGTINILMAAKEMNVKRVIFASSSAVYDEKYDLPHEEEKNILPYSSPYALTKYIGELYLNLYNQIYGLETVCFRYFNVYGPRQDPKGEYAAVIPKFITEILNGETPTIYGDGMQTRDFIYVKDVVRANLLACQQDNISGEVFNIGQGNNTSLEILLKKIKNIVKSDVSHKYDEARPGDVRYSIADISKSKSILGLEPSFDLESGLKLVIKWFKRDLTSNIGKY